MIATLTDTAFLPAALAAACAFAAVYLGAVALLHWIADIFDVSREAIRTERPERRPQDRVLRGLGAVFEPAARLFPESYVRRMENQLVLAGRPHGGITARRYLGAIVALALLAGVATGLVGLGLTLGGGDGLRPLPLAATALAGFAIVLLMGTTRLISEAELVAQDVLKEFPFFLDLAILIVQAGGTPLQALRAYVDAAPGTMLSREIAITVRDAEATSVDQALLRMIPRVRPDPVRAILRNLAQAEKTTGNVAQFYAEQASELRSIREDMAERAAERLKVNLKVPEVMLATAIALAVLAPSIVQMGLL